MFGSARITWKEGVGIRIELREVRVLDVWLECIGDRILATDKGLVYGSGSGDFESRKWSE